MWQKTKRYQVVIFLILVILGMTVLKMVYGYKGENKNTEIKAQITVTPTPDEYPMKNKLPYQGQGFLIEKYTAPKTLRVVLSKASSTSATKAINTWLESFGEAGSGHYVEFEKGN